MFLRRFFPLCCRVPLLVAGLWIGTFACSAKVLGRDWFVSTSGRDTASGTSPEEGKEAGEGPFATLERAREAVRQSIATGDARAHTIHVRGGTYRLREALKLDARDSGHPGAPVVWRAFAGEKPKITGAFPLEGWQIWRGEVQMASLGKNAAVSGGIRQLLFEGERQTLARYPNADPKEPVAGGWAFADGKGWPMYSDIPGEDKHTLQVLPENLRSWSKPDQVEVTVFPRYNWWNDRVRVLSVDPVTRKISLAKECSYAVRKGDRYFFQNALEELDAPGEWYADTAAGMLYFWPPGGKGPEDASVVVAASLLVLEKEAHDILWQGFTFEGCNGTAVSLIGATRCGVESNWICNVGEWSGGGVAVTRGDANRVAYNTIEKVGRTAVSLSGGSVATLSPGNNVAEHNRIRHFGVYFKQGVGIDLSDVGNKALHNEIHDGPRFGIMHRGNCNEIGWNHIYSVCLETEDTGAIYSGGRDWITPRGTTIHSNFIHDIPGFGMHEGKVLSPHFAWGIYLDDNSGGVDVMGNIVMRCGRGGMHGHGARDCVVQNNVFVGNRDWQFDFHGWSTQQSFWDKHLPTMIRGYEAVANQPAWKNMRGMALHPASAPLPDGLTMRGNVFVQNIVVSDAEDKPVMSIQRVPLSHNLFDYNLYWTPGGRVQTGVTSAGPDEGPGLISPFKAHSGVLPEGWRWSSNPSGAGTVSVQGDGSSAFLEISSPSSSGGAGQIVIAGPHVVLEPRGVYRLRARVRSELAGKATLTVHSFVNKEYFWMAPGGVFGTGPEWRDVELVFEVPAEGQKGWHAAMKHFAPRIGWNVGSGNLQVAAMHLHRAERRSPWRAWQDLGADQHSVVADPLWDDAAKGTLRRDSPAWALGFQPIPFEQIGPLMP